MSSGWTVRAPRKSNLAWLPAVLALISLLVQALNLWRTDLKPLVDLGQKNQAALERIEKRLDDHERRLTELEARRGVIRQVKP